MPTYTYRCEDCGRTFHVVERLSEHGKEKPSCPKCRGRDVVQVPGRFYAITGKKT